MKRALGVLAFLLSASLAHAGTTSTGATSKVTPLVAKPFADIPGKEGLMITVEFAPGASDPVHRHNAHVFVYVLEGAIVMQIKGGEEVFLRPGQTFYEAPTDVHLVGRNASVTESAKFLVVLVKDAGAPPVIPGE